MEIVPIDINFLSAFIPKSFWHREFYPQARKPRKIWNYAFCLLCPPWSL